ncbi:MAG: HAD family hydrolase [Pseudomonadota bacterium]
MALALFDLDDTLISGNCETDWFHFLITQGHYDGSTFDEDIAEFDRQYEAGGGDITDYMHFVLAPLKSQSMEVLHEWRNAWFDESGRSMISQRARDQVQQHRAAGDTLVIISASNRFIVEPFAVEFGVDHFMASVPEIIDNRFTGVFEPPACFAEGKITHLERWLGSGAASLNGSYFYSDSRNDVPLLEMVEYPVAVNADAFLANLANERGWPHIDLR